MVSVQYVFCGIKSAFCDENFLSGFGTQGAGLHCASESVL